MADRIKGITVQIGGDTTGLSKALAGVNKELSSTESQLKDVERLLKLDPGNTKLMEQKQRLLAEAVGEAKSKLDTLKETEKQVQQQFAEGKVSQQQYEGLQREISATQTKLETLEAQARQTGSVAAQQLDYVGGKLQAFGGKMSAAGTALLPVTAAVTAAGTAAVTTTAAFDQQMSAVRSISGATGEDFDRLREKALEMGAKTAFSATEAAQALEYMAAAGWSTEDMLAGIDGVMAAAAASGEDLALTSDILTDGLTAFGMGAEDADRFANVLVAAGNASNTSVAMMGETFQYAGSVCGALGISLEDASVAAGLMANSGIKASQAGTTLRAGLTNLVKPTKAMKAAMETYNISIRTAEDGSVDLMATMESLRSGLGGLDETARAAALASIFGKDAMSGWAAVVTATDEDFQALTDAIYNCNGAAEDASEVRLDNLSGQTTILKSTIESISIQIGDVLTPKVEALVEVVQTCADWFASLSDEQRNTVVNVAMVVAALGPLLIVGGKLITLVGTVSKAISGLLAGGITPLMAGIAAVVAAVALIAWKGEELKAWLEEQDAWLREIFVTDCTQSMGILGGVMNVFFDAIEVGWNLVYGVLSGLIDFIRGVFTGDWERAWQGVQDVFLSIFDGIAELMKSPANAMVSILNGLIDSINWVLRSINSISWTNPFTGEAIGFSFEEFAHLPFLATGGTVLRGSAIVGEAGPELLTVGASGTTVTPLTGAKSGVRAAGITLGQVNFYGYTPQQGNELVRDLNRQLGRLYR